MATLQTTRPRTRTLSRPRPTSSITKTDGVSSVTAGDGVTYTYLITVANAGPSNAQAVSVTDTWPAGFSQGTVSPSQGTCSGSPSFTCSLGTLAASSSATITVTYTVPASTSAGTRTNSVTVTSTTTDPTPANNTATDDTTVVTSGGPVDHQDRRRDERHCRNLDDVHDHGHEQRSLDRPGRRRHQRPDPGRHDRLRDRGRLLDRRRHVQLHDGCGPRPRRVGQLPADARGQRRLRRLEPVEHGFDHDLPGQ